MLLINNLFLKCLFFRSLFRYWFILLIFEFPIMSGYFFLFLLNIVHLSIMYTESLTQISNTFILINADAIATMTISKINKRILKTLHMNTYISLFKISNHILQPMLSIIFLSIIYSFLVEAIVCAS